MKKLFLSLMLISVLAVLVLPAVVDAQAPPAKLSECCKIKKDNTGGYDEGEIVGAPNKPDGTPAECKYGTIPDDNKTGDWGAICLMNSINVITDWVFYLFMALTVVFIILGAVTFMAAAGDPEKASKGKRFITYAVIGVVIGLLAKALPAIVRGVMGF